MNKNYFKVNLIGCLLLSAPAMAASTEVENVRPSKIVRAIPKSFADAPIASAPKENTWLQNWDGMHHSALPAGSIGKAARENVKG